MPPLPQTQRAVQINKNGGTEVLELNQIPIPTPKTDEVLIKNTYAGVNFIDTYFRSGLYPAPSFPYTLGREATGTVVTPSGTLAANTRVVYLGPSSQAEYAVAPLKHVFPIPEGVPDESACAAILQGLTALTMIRESYAVKSGDKILVHAAAGGVGLWLVQLLKQVGATVIATAGSDEKLALAQEFGADVLINYSLPSPPWKDAVLEATQGVGVEAIFDGVGKATFDDGLEVLRRKGTFVSFGNASGAVEPVRIARLAPKCLKLVRPMLFGYVETEEEFAVYAGELFGWIREGKIKVKVGDVKKLEEVGEAQTELEGRRTVGKVLLKI